MPPLTEMGERQALEAAKKLVSEPRFDAVVTSGLTRARQTGAIIAEHLGVKQVDIIEDLQERDIGKYQGLTHAEVTELNRGRNVDDVDEAEKARLVGWESNEALGRRIQSAFHEIARRYPGKRVLVISHGGSMMQLCRCLGLTGSRFPNLSGREFEVDTGTNEILIGEFVPAPVIEDDSTVQEKSKGGNTIL